MEIIGRGLGKFDQEAKKNRKSCTAFFQISVDEVHRLEAYIAAGEELQKRLQKEPENELLVKKLQR